MKLELIKETDFNGKTWFYIHQDGRFISGSVMTNYEDAFKMYQTIKEGITAKKEVLLSEEL